MQLKTGKNEIAEIGRCQVVNALRHNAKNLGLYKGLL
jgi:hypothetical protein